MALFTNRAELRREFYQLVGSKSADAELIAQGESVDDIANRCVMYGIWNAQTYLISIGAGGRWRKVSATLSFSGSDSADGGKYVAAPSDLLRMAGDEDNSALREPDGTPWGTEIDERDRFKYRGDFYYLLDHAGAERLWLARGASPPTTLALHYYYRHATLAGDTGTGSDAIDFPELDRPLIPAEGAYYAMHQSWFVGDSERRAAIMNNRDLWREQASNRTRRSRQVPRQRQRRGMGTHYMV